MPRMLHTRARKDTKFSGQYSRSAINVSGRTLPLLPKQQQTDLRLGSRYIYELYYDKDAVSKQLYEWLLKNGYADANLIAKWKKQGYEKVRTPLHCSLLQDEVIDKHLAALLPPMCTDQGDKFQLYLHLSSPQGTAKRRSNHRMC